MTINFTHVDSNEGLNALSSNPCKLLDFHLLVLPARQSYSGINKKNREIVAVIMEGKADFSVDQIIFAGLGERANVFEGKPYSVYIPAGVRFTITAVSDVQIALCSAPSDLQVDPYVVTPEQVTTGVWGRHNFTRHFRKILTIDAFPNLPVQHLIVGETITPSGNWSTYPAHKHEADNLPDEAYHEEMYFFKILPNNGFGITRFYHNNEDAVNFTVCDNSILMMPDGYHTYVGAPGFTSYYLWFLAGNQRTQGVSEDQIQAKEVAKIKE